MGQTRTCEALTREELLVYVGQQNRIIDRLITEVERLLVGGRSAFGRKGGLARAAKMTKDQRVACARKAAAARWGVREALGEG